MGETAIPFVAVLISLATLLLSAWAMRSQPARVLLPMPPVAILAIVGIVIGLLLTSMTLASVFVATQIRREHENLGVAMQRLEGRTAEIYRPQRELLTRLVRQGAVRNYIETLPKDQRPHAAILEEIRQAVENR